MKQYPFLLLVLGSTAVLPQSGPPSVTTPSATIAHERARIESLRQTEGIRFAGEEAACYQRFAVNDCLREVRARRRGVLEALRRQEIELNDAQRGQQAADRLRRLGAGATEALVPTPPAERASEPTR